VEANLKFPKLARERNGGCLRAKPNTCTGFVINFQ
jgi:hypothetical protein